MEQAGDKQVPRHRQVLGAYVSRARKERGLTQAELAERLAEHGMQTHPTSIAKIEAGTRGVSVDELVAMADALGWDGQMLASLLSPPSAIGAAATETAADLGLAVVDAYQAILWALGLQEKGAEIVRKAQEDGIPVMDDEAFKTELARSVKRRDDTYRVSQLAKVLGPELVDSLPQRAREGYARGERHER